MANKKVFQSLVGKLVPKTDALNKEAAPAYVLKPEHRIAQYAVTGCLNVSRTERSIAVPGVSAAAIT